jgi:hypothetical protein
MWLSFRSVLYVLSAVFSILFATLAAADPYGNPFRVNTYTPGGQSVSRVSTGANGDTAVLIRDAARGGASFVRRYDAAGRALTSEEWYVGFGAYGVAVSGSGNYAIMRSAPDGSGQGIFVAVYNRAGSIIVPEFRVNDATAGEQYAGTIAMNANGQFVVSWSQSAGTGLSYLVKRYQANGAPVAPATVVRTTLYNSIGSEVAIDSLGNFVVTWSELISPTGNNFDVFARRYASTGVASGPVFRVNTYTTGLQVSSWVSMNATGNFVISWTSHGQTGTYSWNVYAQRYSATGAALGGEFQVNAVSSYYQPTVGVALASNGSFVITWSTDNTAVNPSERPYVLARSYTATGTPFGAPFAVSTTASVNNGFPYAATDPDGNTFIAWGQYDSVDSDVYARRFLPVGAVAQLLPNPGQMNGLSGAAGSWQYFKITVPAGHTTLDVSIFGSVGDADLYLRFGALPTLSRWDARPYIDGSNESVRMQNWPAGDWYIGINGYSAYSALILQGASY